jgi:hypothetical protein
MHHLSVVKVCIFCGENPDKYVVFCRDGLIQVYTVMRAASLVVIMGRLELPLQVTNCHPELVSGSQD